VKVQGYLYKGDNSQRHSAELVYSSTGNLSCVLEGHLAFAAPISEVTISDRIGNTPRFIHFPNQAKFESDDNQCIDDIVKTSSMHGFIKPSLINRWAHSLESSYKVIAFTLVTVILSSWAFVQYGLPQFSKELAMLLPAEVATKIGHGSLDLLDDSIMKDSELSEERQQALRHQFEQIKPKYKNENHIALDIVFRQSEAIGANAFALPSGTILFTDEMIALAENDKELQTIMLHEIGHIENRHSLQQLIQQSSLALFVILVTGDVSTTSSLILALPSLLLNAQFSQGMEIEADQFALERLKENNLTGQHFAAIMKRLEASHSEKVKHKEAKPESNQTLGKISNYFSSHPATEERIKRFEAVH